MNKNDSNKVLEFSEYGITNENELLQHEKLTFGISNIEVLKDKFKKYLNTINVIIKAIENNNNELYRFIR